jgi:hypothetical protein
MTASADVTAAPVAMRMRPGLLVAGVLLAVYGGLALTVDFPQAAIGIQSDEATYYLMGHSLARDGDLTYRRQDLERVWREFPSGPAGVFLKKGRDIRSVRLTAAPPFVEVRTRPDPDPNRLYYGKSFVYPLAAAPLVRLFGTNGFLVLHAVLLALVVLCGYLFLHARMPADVSVLLASSFVMASVVPVYFVWITPELFNFALGALAYFCWLYKEVASPATSPRGTRWLFGAGSDLAAAALLGAATFSKPSNLLLYIPIGLWLLWRRRWSRIAAAAAVFLAASAGLFGANLAISGEWNYQGGERSTFYAEFPFQTTTSGFDVGLRMARDEAMTDVILDPGVFWTNLRANLAYFFVGRYSGLVAYFFPAVFALLAFAAARRSRKPWQYLVLAGGLAQILLFVISVPYTYFGGGGSVGNRYFMGAYGVFLFLLPPITRTWVALVPWIVGACFTAQLTLNPFASSFQPGEYAKHAPLRWLPVELTNVNDLPINTNAARVRVWFGDNPGVGDPGFQIYFLDDYAYDREADKSFWVKGESRAEFLIKTDRPMRRAELTFTAGPVATDVRVSLGGRTQRFRLEPAASRQVSIALDEGFPYLGRYVWVASVSSSSGFSPIFHDDLATDTRYLGVRVKPVLVP